MRYLMMILFMLSVTVWAQEDAAESQQQAKAQEKAAAPQRRVDSILVSVNGKPISLMDIVNESRPEEARLSYLYKGDKLYDEVKNLRLKVMNEIIKRYLILDDYERNPYDIPVQLIESMLDDLAESFGCTSRAELAVKAKESGTTVDELRRKARERLILQSMISSYCFRNIHLTPREIHEYYTAHKEEFTKPARVKLAVIYLKNDRADLERARGDIEEKVKEDKANFARMAHLYTDGIGADNGGDLGWVEEKGLRPEFNDALKTMAVGDISPAIMASEGCYFLQLTGREEETVQDFKIAGPALYKEIEAKMREEAVTRYVERLKKDAIIRYGE